MGHKTRINPRIKKAQDPYSHQVGSLIIQLTKTTKECDQIIPQVINVNLIYASV